MAKRSSRSRLRTQRIYRARKSAYSSFSRAYESERSRWTERGKKIFSPIKYSTFRSEITSLMENEDLSAGEALRSVKSKVNKYITYLKEFRERQDKFEARGLEFNENSPYSFDDWVSQYATKLNDLKKEKEKGLINYIGSVNKELVSDQAYELSRSKAELVADYLFRERPDLVKDIDFRIRDPKTGEIVIDPETGEPKINLKKRIDFIMKLRQGQFVEKDVGFWNMIKSERERLFNLSKDEMEKLKKRFDAGTDAEAVAKQIGQSFFESK